MPRYRLSLEPSHQSLPANRHPRLADPEDSNTSKVRVFGSSGVADQLSLAVRVAQENSGR